MSNQRTIREFLAKKNMEVVESSVRVFQTIDESTSPDTIRQARYLMNDAQRVLMKLAVNQNFSEISTTDRERAPEEEIIHCEEKKHIHDNKEQVKRRNVFSSEMNRAKASFMLHISTFNVHGDDELFKKTEDIVDKLCDESKHAIDDRIGQCVIDLHLLYPKLTPEGLTVLVEDVARHCSDYENMNQ